MRQVMAACRIFRREEMDDQRYGGNPYGGNPYGGSPYGGQQPDPAAQQMSPLPQYPETASATTSPDNANSGGLAYAIAAAAIALLMFAVMGLSQELTAYIQEVAASDDPTLEEQPFSEQGYSLDTDTLIEG